tara:strand:+ start:1657 stop:3927 length:2271 start_codon:yes stop_codon:yes gene_type:complete
MKKNTIILFFLVSQLASTQNIVITETGGALETAFIKWQPVVDAESYNVYYSGEGIVDKKIDTELIRSYGTYFRADVLGLKPGSYTIKVTAVIASEEKEATSSASIAVKEYDRTGFAFSNGRVPGAYKMDGTPKDNAIILYITQNTKNTISLDVNGANENPCIGLETILEGFKKGSDNRPLIVRLIGQITDLDYMDKGDIVIENKNNSASYITLEGVGNDAVADGWGIRVKNATNIEIRNIGTMNCDSDEGDNIGLQQGNDYIWVHNNDFFYGNSGSDADQAKGDGALDCKRSTYVTFSYNHFWDSGKSNLLGLSEDSTEGLYITYHHNWFDHSDSRHPRVRFYSAHVYNNYYDGNSKYGVGATEGSSVFVEANYFRNCKYPMLTSMQGSDVFSEGSQSNDYSNNPTFSKEDGGSIKAFNNFMTGQKRFIAYGVSGFTAFNSTVDFDAYVVSTRNETIGTEVISNYGSNSYNNFDTDAPVMYQYTPDSPEEAKDNVMQYSGRIHGGDFTWTFNNDVDDTSYAVNTPLKDALINYTTNLVAVQGDGQSTDGGGNGNDGGTGPNPGDEIHNFTESGITSTFYTITGNLSDSKGDAHYNGLTLTQCLKIESSTNIIFSAESESKLTLVFNDGFNGSIKINGENKEIVNGLLNITISTGEYTITKSVSTNLYYMSVEAKTLVTNKKELLKMSLYPNPTKNGFYIKSKIEIKGIRIYNVLGKLVKIVNKDKQYIDISTLSKGSYFVKVFTEEGIINKVIIKE